MEQRLAAPTTQSPDRTMRGAAAGACPLRFSDDTNARLQDEVEWYVGQGEIISTPTALAGLIAKTACQGLCCVRESEDTGIKLGVTNDWSVCITAVLRDKKLYIIDVWRGRVEFPELRDKAIELARLHGAGTLLIEDKASGQQLIQTLRGANLRGVPEPIAINPEGDKVSRAIGVSSMVEAGQVFLPAEGHWLGEFKSEVLSFPSGKYDDQVDALSQLLGWVRTRLMYTPTPSAGPEVYTFDDYGNVIGDPDEHDSDKFNDDPWGAY